MKQLLGIFAVLLALAGCSKPEDLTQPPEPMGHFLLGHNIVVANDPPVGPFSRKASNEEWIASLKGAIDERFRRYDGDQYYHIAIRVDGFVLALPGIPIVASPKSVLALSVTVWDDAKGSKINEEPKTFTVWERLSGETVISSGLTQSKATQMENLSRNAAKLIHKWMLENKQWFGAPVEEAMMPETN